MSAPASIPSLSCPKCEHPFRSVPSGDHGDLRPFLIPTCGHTVCGACASAQASALSKERSDVIAACPMCGEGASGDAILNSLIATAAEAAYARTHATPVVLECMYCLDEGDSVPATHVCFDCNGKDRPLCDFHLTPHRQKRHASLIPVSEYKGPLCASSVPNGPALCPSHPKYELDRFCFTCEAPVCIACCLSAGSHPEASHNVKDVATAAGTLRSQLESLKAEAAAVANTVASHAVDVDGACTRMGEGFVASMKSFNAWIERMVVALLKLQADVTEASEATLRSQTHALRAQSMSLRASSCQLHELLSLIGQQDLGEPAILAGMYGVLKRVVSGATSKPFTGPGVVPFVELGFDESALSTAIASSAWVQALSTDLCELSGPGLEGFIGGGTDLDDALEQNAVKLVCRDDKRDIVRSIDIKDVSLRVWSTVDAESIIGVTPRVVCDRPGIFSFVYVVGNEDVEAVDLDVRLFGVPVTRSRVRVPAIPTYVFPGSTVLACVPLATLRRFTAGLKTWLPDGGKPELLYRMSRDGMSPLDFHSRCDGIASTVTLIKSSNGFVFGGYAGEAWHGEGSYIYCSKSFIFTVTNPHGIPPTRYLVNYPECALYGEDAYGPTFGGDDGVDYCNDIALGDSNCLSGEGYTRFSSYTDTTGKGDNTFTGTDTFTAAEVEVWQLPLSRYA